jgi:hypothetical protein
MGNRGVKGRQNRSSRTEERRNGVSYHPGYVVPTALGSTNLVEICFSLTNPPPSSLPHSLPSLPSRLARIRSLPPDPIRFHFQPLPDSSSLPASS